MTILRVLMIEDDEMLGGALRDHVAAEEGMPSTGVGRLDDAEAARSTVAYDLLLLDLGLPDGRGLDFLNRLRRRGAM